MSDDDQGQLDSYDSHPVGPPSDEHDPGFSPADHEVLLAPGHDVNVQVAGLLGSVRDHTARLKMLEDFTGGFPADILDNLADLATIAAGRLASSGQTPDTAEPAQDQRREQRGDDTGSDPEAQFELRVLVSWVRENVAAVVERHIPGSRSPNWCPLWWRHPEAIARFEAARRAWLEACDGSGSALSVYWQHLDHHLGVLMGEGGTFHHCREGKHTATPITARRLWHYDPDDSVYAQFAAAQTTPGIVPGHRPTDPTLAAGDAASTGPTPRAGRYEQSGAGGGMGAGERLRRQPTHPTASRPGDGPSYRMNGRH